MSWIRRSVTRAVLIVAVMAAMLVLTGLTASAADETYVQYYTVTSSYNGAPENLTEIASRFLGDGARSAEVFNLNTGRKQPDGQVLTDPGRLNPGWKITLPWDAEGPGVQIGVLPGRSTGSRPKPSGSSPGNGTGTGSGTGTDSSGTNSRPGGVVGSGSTSGSSNAVPGGSTAAGPKKGAGAGRPKRPAGCATAAAAGNRSDWASLRLAAEQAWPQSRGKGQLVAIVDSGVDGSLSQLSGHVAVGTDIAGGTGRGDIDCLGSGTAMAGLIAAQPSKGGISGVAPEATVMPVRIVDRTPRAQPADGAAGISAAVTAGATVIALGSSVNLNDTEVAKAVGQAIERGVLVVAGAPPASVPVNPKASIGKGLLRVGGVGVDGQGAADYVSGGVDVVAPGVNVGSIGITGTGSVAGSGTHYAVAFVAGVAALVRSAYPDLTPAQVAHRIQATADGTERKGKAGWGMINPAKSVTKVLPEEAAAAKAEMVSRVTSPPATRRTTLLVIVGLVALMATLLLVMRIRRLLQGDDDGDKPVAVSTSRPAPARSTAQKLSPPSPPDITVADNARERETVSLAAAPSGGIARSATTASTAASTALPGPSPADTSPEPAASKEERDSEKQEAPAVGSDTGTTDPESRTSRDGTEPLDTVETSGSTDKVSSVPGEKAAVGAKSERTSHD
jgi:membrane-anchored mycosin MYCP